MNAISSAHTLDVSFRRYGAAEARRLSDTVEALYVSSYVDAIASGDSFNSVEAFMSRFRAYSSQPGFDLVLAYHDEQAIGQAWGWPLSADTGWWTGLRTEPEPGFTREDGRRTFALSEIMVVREWDQPKSARSA